jgi:hypothetical protein
VGDVYGWYVVGVFVAAWLIWRVARALMRKRTGHTLVVVLAWSLWRAVTPMAMDAKRRAARDARYNRSASGRVRSIRHNRTAKGRARSARFEATSRRREYKALAYIYGTPYRDLTVTAVRAVNRNQPSWGAEALKGLKFKRVPTRCANCVAQGRRNLLPMGSRLIPIAGP